MKQLLFHWTAKTKACCVSRQRERRRGLLLCLRKPVLSFHAVPQPGLRTVLAPQSWLKCCSVVRWPGMQRVWSVSHNYQKIRLNISFISGILPLWPTKECWGQAQDYNSQQASKAGCWQHHAVRHHRRPFWGPFEIPSHPLSALGSQGEAKQGHAGPPAAFRRLSCS